MVDGLLTLFEKLLPIYLEAVKSGQITPEQQEVVAKRSAAIRANIIIDPVTGKPKFLGPEWEKKP